MCVFLHLDWRFLTFGFSLYMKGNAKRVPSERTSACSTRRAGSQKPLSRKTVGRHVFGKPLFGLKIKELGFWSCFHLPKAILGTNF